MMSSVGEDGCVEGEQSGDGVCAPSVHLVHRRQRVSASSTSLICFRNQSGREDTAPQCAVYLVCVYIYHMYMCMCMWRDG